MPQRHPLPASTHVEPQRRVSSGQAVLIVGSARFTPAVLDLATLHVCVFVEPRIRLPHSPHDPTVTPI
jgi:hypothetical protein